jgi:hypothetical protein
MWMLNILWRASAYKIDSDCFICKESTWKSIVHMSLLTKIIDSECFICKESKWKFVVHIPSLKTVISVQNYRHKVQRGKQWTGRNVLRWVWYRFSRYIVMGCVLDIVHVEQLGTAPVGFGVGGTPAWVRQATTLSMKSGFSTMHFIQTPWCIQRLGENFLI